MANHKVSKSCKGETCNNCKIWESSHKVGEEILDDAEPKMKGGLFSGWEMIPIPRHNLTAYICCNCFRQLFGKHACKSWDDEIDEGIK